MSVDQHSGYSEETLNQVVCWRETLSKWFILEGQETRHCKERATVYANLDEYQARVDEFLNLLNEQQCEIKSVVVFQQGKGFSKKKIVSFYHGGAGWGIGWGVSIPDRVQVFYEKAEYIPFGEYLKRKETVKARLEREEREHQEAVKARREREEREREAQEAFEHNQGIDRQMEGLFKEKSLIEDEIEKIETQGVRKTKRSLIGSEIVYNFNTINYETLEAAEQAKAERLQELRQEVSELEGDINQLKKSRVDV